jgi:hypothetical protein
MSKTITSDCSVAAETLAAAASDGGDTGVLDVGTGSGLLTGDGSELSSGLPVYPTLGLETLVAAATRAVTDADASVPFEAGERLGRDTAAPAESPRRSAADAAATVESLGLLLLDPPAPAERGARLIGNAMLPLESIGTAALGVDLALPVEASVSLRSDCVANAEQLVLSRADAVLPVENSTLARGDAAVETEAFGVYVVRVTLTLSDGSVLTFAAA